MCANRPLGDMASPPGTFHVAHGTPPMLSAFDDAVFARPAQFPDLHIDFIDALVDLLHIYAPFLHECAIYFALSHHPEGARFRYDPQYNRCKVDTLYLVPCTFMKAFPMGTWSPRGEHWEFWGAPHGPQG